MASRRDWTTWKRALSGVLMQNEKKNLGLVAAGVAFWGIFAIFPALAALISIFGLLADPAVVETQLELMDEIIPPQAYALFADQIGSLLQARSGALGWTSIVSFAITFWTARAGIAALMLGLNAINDRPGRGNVRHNVVALTLTASLLGVAIGALLTVVVAPVILSFLHLGDATAWVIQALRWAAALAVLLTGLGLLYRFGPNARGARPGLLSPGAVMVIVLWLLISVLFSLYLSNFGRFNEVYGSIGAVIAMLIWLWISAYLILLGATLNAELRAATKREPVDPDERDLDERAPHVP